MKDSETIKKIASLNQATGKFEQLATAVLRKSNPLYYQALVHTGVNTDGQPIKGPLDGICFVPNVKPPHMISVHHTTGNRDKIREKWLRDPSKVKQKKEGVKLPLAGDVLKTAEIYDKERKRTPKLEGTLVLTVTSDPPQDVLRDAEFIAREADFSLDIWSVSRIADFLDTDPEGQYLRRIYLGITEERLSPSLLSKLSKKSLEFTPLLNNPDTWIKRELDSQLKNNYRPGLTLVSAGSGQGKSVACFKCLSDHIESGHYGLVIPHKIIIDSSSIEQAIQKTLKDLYPSLMGDCGQVALNLSSINSKFLVVIEDINRSGQAEVLVERIAGWHSSNTNNSWQILCPVWPQFLTSLNEPVEKIVKDLVLSCDHFSIEEGARAILKRYEPEAKSITDLEAEEISTALGHDPLLIGLYEVNDVLEPQKIIEKFVFKRLEQLQDGDFLVSELLQSIYALISKMHDKRIIQLTSLEDLGLSSNEKNSLKKIHKQGQIFRFVGDASSQILVFRHDRVRDWLSSSAIAKGLYDNDLSGDFLSEPYYSKVIGLALNKSVVTAEVVSKIKPLNPLALFYSLQDFSVAKSDTEKAVVTCITEWLEEDITHTKSNENLRKETIRVLSQIDSPHVLDILEHYNDEGWLYFIAGFRNGKLANGIDYFSRRNLPFNYSDEQLVAYVLSKHPTKLMEEINSLLVKNNLSLEQYSGLLILAGLTKNSNLFDSLKSLLKTILKIDDIHFLGHYLWACAHCCGDSPEELLAPIIDVWGSLSDEKNDGFYSDKEKLTFEVRTAFQRFIPKKAISYFIEQAKKRSDLTREISYMLNEIDHPEAVAFLAETNAQKELEVKENDSHSSVVSDTYAWKTTMKLWETSLSKESKNKLYEIWNDSSKEQHYRKEAFELWSFSHAENDLEKLKKSTKDELLKELVIRERVIRNDYEVLPQFIELIEKGKDFESYWWQFARDYWADDLTILLDKEMDKRSHYVSNKWGEESNVQSDSITYELIVKLPVSDAEKILIKHWEHLKYNSTFILAALYVATESLLKLVKIAVADCPDPKSLFELLEYTYGLRLKGVNRIEQLEVLVPYLGFFREKTIESLWRLCNEKSWFEFRKEHFDKLLEETDFNYAKYLSEGRAVKSLDSLSGNDCYLCRNAERWAEKYLEAGVTKQEVFDVIFKWIAIKEITLQVIKVSLAITIKIGDRSDFASLADVCSEVMDKYGEYFENAYFLLKKKHLH